MKKLVFLSDTQLPRDAMTIIASERIDFIQVNPYEENVTEALRAYAPEAIIYRMGGLRAPAIAASSNLRLIVKHGVGVDDIDVAAATRSGIPVLITAGANARSVAEHTLGLMLAIARNIPRLDGRLRHGHWDKRSQRGTELAGKSIGIVGYGNIGKAVATLTHALGMSVCVYDPHIDNTKIPVPVIPFRAFHDLIAAVDFVSLHCPLTQETRGMVGAREFSLMRKSAYLINAARGELVDELALIPALESARIAGAALDTFEIEPLAATSSLLLAPNLVLTPHVGANTAEALERTGIAAVRQVVDFFAGQAINRISWINRSS